MGLYDYIKRSKYKENVSFFQTSYPYAWRNSLTVDFHNYYNSRWNNEDPNASQTFEHFLSIDNGHYGLYFCILNRDFKKRKSASDSSVGHDYLGLAWLDSMEPRKRGVSWISISRVKDDVYSNIRAIKSFSKNHLSTLSVVLPKVNVWGRRRYSTSSRRKILQTDVGQEEGFEAEELMDETDDFKATLLNTQLVNIEKIYNTQDPKELDLIYPLYQTLKRNGIALPTIQHYNMVLGSISKRSLNNDRLDFEAIESRLTTLLTIYQDILDATSFGIKPDSVTYETILAGLFEGSIQTISIGYGPSCNRFQFEKASSKSREFCQIGLSLFQNIKSCTLSLETILPYMLVNLNLHPYLLNSILMDKIISLRETMSQSSFGLYYVTLISLSKHLKNMNYFSSEAEHYKFIESVYEQYKAAASESPELLEFEFVVYAALVRGLIDSGNFNLATKFLDDILVDFKSKLLTEFPSNIMKSELSEVLSIYMEAILATGKEEDLIKSYNLLMQFKNLSYLPELSTTLYNNMINQFNNLYHILEEEKSNNSYSDTEIDHISKKQYDYYTIMWKLYNHLAIRKDYHENDKHYTFADLLLHDKVFNCREYLLSLSIDLGDHERAFEIIKEIILKNHLIFDSSVLNKLLGYLYNGSTLNEFNRFYYGVLTSLVESQATYYRDPVSLSEFASVVTKYILIGHNEHSLKFLLNSKMVDQLFSSFELLNHNKSGIIEINLFFIQYTSIDMNHVTGKDLNRILHLQSLIIHELEDPDNIYCESKSLLEFKASVENSFKSNLDFYLSNHGSSLSNDIITAAELCNYGLDSTVAHFSPPQTREIDLSVLLNVNYDVGVERFISSFIEGCNFNAATWKIIVNEQFMSDYLERNEKIKIEHFLNRLLASDVQNSEKVGLLIKIVKFENDKINIRVFKMILSASEFATDDILEAFMGSLLRSSNVYLHNMVSENFERLLAINGSSLWLDTYLKAALKTNNKRIMNKITLVKLIDDESPESWGGRTLLLTSLLKIHAKLGQFKEFGKLFRSQLSKENGKDLILSSPELSNILIKYYLYNGSFAVIEQVFNNFKNLSTETQNLILFNQFMLSTSGRDICPEVKSHANLNKYALNLLMCDDLSSMVDLSKLNTRHKTDLVFGSVMRYMARAAAINCFLGLNHTSLQKKYTNLLKLMKMINLKTIEFNSFLLVVSFLTTTGSTGELSMILNKLVNDNHLSKYINYYFFNVPLFKDNQNLILLSTLKNSFLFLEDKINIHTINEVVRANHLKLQTNEFNNDLIDLILA